MTETSEALLPGFTYDRNWARIDVDSVPRVVVDPPGPRSAALHDRAARHIKGFSSQVRLFPVAFDHGHGVTLTDVDGNLYLDFSSGIYVTSLGHCHPKVSEAIARYAARLMNCHDFSTPVKTALAEKMAAIAPGDLSGLQLYDSGTTAVEAGLRVMRAATGKSEFISFHNAFHGKTLAAASLGPMDPTQGLRAPGFIRAPGSYPYRCPWGDDCADCGLRCVENLQEVIKQQSANRVAGIVVEPIQGWAGSIVPHDSFMPALRALCDELGLLLMADEVLVGMGRTGKMFCVDHWNVVPDLLTTGKGFGNGFPVTGVLISDRIKDAVEKISASTSYGGNPMACAAALASIEVIEEEGLCERSAYLGDIMLRRLQRMKETHPIIGDVRGKGCILGIELVRDRATREPFSEAGVSVYQKAFARGLAWIPAGHILRISPPLIMDEDVALKGLDIIEEAIGETEREFGYA
ncbi:MAG: aspartate aminotransferase family protein [Chloroflexota bacterium]